LKTADAAAGDRGWRKLCYGQLTERSSRSPKTCGHDYLITCGCMCSLPQAICKRPWLEAAAVGHCGRGRLPALREKTLDGGELLRRARILVKCVPREEGVVQLSPIAAISRDGCRGRWSARQGRRFAGAVEARKIVGSRMILGRQHAQSGAGEAGGSGWCGLHRRWAEFFAVKQEQRHSARPGFCAAGGQGDQDSGRGRLPEL